MRTAYLAAFLPFLLATGANASDYCREYTGSVKVGGRTQESYGTACLQADGSWQIQPDGGQGAYREPEVIVIEKPTRTVVVDRPTYRPHYRRVYVDYDLRRDKHHHHRYDRGRGHDRHHSRNDHRWRY